MHKRNWFWNRNISINCINYYIQGIESNKYSQKRDGKQASIREFMDLMGLFYFIGTMTSQQASDEKLWTADETEI